MMTKSTSLTSLPQKKVTTGLKRLQEAGITPEQWLKMLDTHPEQLQKLVAAWPSGQRSTGIVYDAAAVSRILGLPCTCDDPVPTAADGEIVIYYGGWDIPALKLCPAGEHMSRKDREDYWYHRMGWKAEPGYYRLNLRVSGTLHMNWGEQDAYVRTLDPTQEIAPIAVAATAVLVHLAETGSDLLKNEWCRCRELVGNNRYAGLAVHFGRLKVTACNNGGVWLASSRKF